MTTLLALAVAVPQLLFEGDIEYEYRLAYVRATVNGNADGLFLLDTGANMSAIDSSFAKKVGVRPGAGTKVEGTAGTVEVPTATLERYSLGKASSEKFKVTLQDFGGFLKPSGKSVDGILGSDFLKGYTVKLDFGRRKLQLWGGSAPQPGIKVSMRMDNGIPLIPALLNGNLKTNLRIDTGAGLFESKDVYLNVPMRVFDQLGLRAQKYFTGSGTGGEVKLPVAQTESLLVGTLKVAKPYVIGQPAQGYFARPDAVGFVGNNFLEKYSPIALDYTKGWLVLTPSS